MSVQPLLGTAAEPAGWVDGVPISVEETALGVPSQVALIHQHFLLRHQVCLDEPEDWERIWGGEQPLDRLRQAVFAEAVKAKIIQIEAARAGVGRMLEFPDYVREAESLMARKRAAQARGEVVYGGLHLGALQSYRREIDRQRLALHRVLKDSWKAQPKDAPFVDDYDAWFEHFMELAVARAEVRTNAAGLAKIRP